MLGFILFVLYKFKFTARKIFNQAHNNHSCMHAYLFPSVKVKHKGILVSCLEWGHGFLVHQLLNKDKEYNIYTYIMLTT